MLIRKRYPYILAFVFGFGVGVILTLAAVFDHPTPRCEFIASTPTIEATEVSDIAKELAAPIGKDLQTFLNSSKDDIVAGAGGPLVRGAVRMGFPSFVKHVPGLCEIAIDKLLSKFGKMSLGELAVKLAKHNAAKGLPSDPSISRAASLAPSDSEPSFFPRR